MHRAFTILVFGTLCVLAGQAVTAQNPPAAGAPGPASSSKKQHSHKDDFLMRGTVFTEKNLSLPGADLRVRRGSEKKFRWETRTNSRGEFAVRVPQGAEYELVVRAKGFAEQARPVDAKSGVEKDNMVFRMELAPEKKTGGKK
jgi:hypothetical protein